MKQVREAAKRGDPASAKVIAREIVHTRKTIGQLYMNKAHMISMNAQLTEQLGVVKVAGTLSKSTQVCLSFNSVQPPPSPTTSSSLCRLPLPCGFASFCNSSSSPLANSHATSL